MQVLRDYRLADLDATTIGLKYGITRDENSEFAIRVERYTQSSGGDAPFPDVYANIVQLNYSLNF